MSNNAVSLTSINKTFKRFVSPGWRALDALGVKVKSSKYDLFKALSAVTLEIKKGEKVALIGRNGAGKSTLLRIISGQVQPTSGFLHVNGNLQALMELGTGFHPDFTGVENILSSLAYQGVFGRKADKIVDEIVDFTELGDFIYRPVQEYSAGMYARLAFATATTIVPDILIIDEILGAGDAYFVGKCIQRMKALTADGATVLFVSHDMSSAQMLCDRGIWIDKGQVVADGDMLSVSKAYLEDVRKDEEKALRIKSNNLNNVEDNITSGTTLYRFITQDGKAPASDFTLAEIKFGTDEIERGNVSIQDLTNNSRLIIDDGGTNWSKLDEFENRQVRKFGDYGAKFIHAPFQISWGDSKTKNRWLEYTYIPSKSDVILLDEYDEEKSEYKTIATIEKSDGSDWKKMKLDLTSLNFEDQLEHEDNFDLQRLSSKDRYGKGPIKITAFGFIDESNDRRHTLITGEKTRACISYQTSEVVHNPVAVIAIYRHDGTCAMQVVSNIDGTSLGAIDGSGNILVNFNPMLLGPGEYIASVAFFKELDISSKHEPKAYDLLDRCYPLKVMHPLGIGIEIGIVNQPVMWEIQHDPR